MSDHTPWAKIKHKRAERKAARVLDITEMLRVSMRDVILEHVQEEYGLSFERLDMRGMEGYAWAWTLYPREPHDHRIMLSEFIRYADFSFSKHLYHHERVGLFGGTAFDLGEFAFTDFEAMERGMKREFYSSLTKALKELRGIDVISDPQHLGFPRIGELDSPA